MYKLSELENPADLYDRLMALIVRLGEFGLIHGDFNEFNIMITDDLEVVLIDFPQMTSMDHENAEFFFNRDVECVREFFRKKLKFDSEDFPKFADVERKYDLDVELAASGFTKKMAQDVNKVF